jgi:aldose 1-epimerase
MPGLTIIAGRYEATFRPDDAMLCTSLRYGGEEYVARPRTLAEFRAGAATAIPLVHPWVNRLSRWGYGVAGRRVSLRGLALPVDTDGLPIHGNLFAVPFDVVRYTEPRIVARLDYGEHPDKLRAFPFPHRLTVDATLSESAGLRVTTTVEPTTDVAVPVSFGWHPYVRLPRTPRRSWILRWPSCEHVEVDDRVIPTGARTPQPRQAAPIGDRTFDDLYALGRDRVFSITTDERSLTFRFDRAYPFAQLFIPPRRQHVAIEPMTAEIDALNRGSAPLVAPNDVFRATFSLTVEP